MKVEFKDLVEIAKDPNYVFINYEKQGEHIYTCGSGTFNYMHGTLEDDEAKTKYKQVKKLYGFMVSKSSKNNGKLTGNKVCEFFLCDNYWGTSLVSKDGFNADFTPYLGHTIFENIKEWENRKQQLENYGYKLFDNFELYTTREEALEALKVVRKEMGLLVVDERKAYLEEQIKFHQDEINKLKKELAEL